MREIDGIKFCLKMAKSDRDFYAARVRSLEEDISYLENQLDLYLAEKEDADGV